VSVFGGAARLRAADDVARADRSGRLAADRGEADQNGLLFDAD